MKFNATFIFTLALLLGIFVSNIAFAGDFKVELVGIEYYNSVEKCKKSNHIMARELYKVYNADLSDLVYTRVDSYGNPYTKKIKYAYQKGRDKLIPYGYCIPEDSSYSIKVRFSSQTTGAQSNTIELNIKPENIKNTPVPNLIKIQ